MTGIEAIIDDAWDARDGVSVATAGDVRRAVDAALAGLDAGELRVAEPDGVGGWRTPMP
jgi:2,3,4,5-tetrahydropyridine-2,6-dicarboxylate N-succinyltransferase